MNLLIALLDWVPSWSIFRSKKPTNPPIDRRMDLEEWDNWPIDRNV